MTAEPKIGIAGYGAVGRSVHQHLRSRFSRFRLGSRRQPDYSGQDPGVEVTKVDAADPEAMLAFCAGCDLVVNCAGPSRNIGSRMAMASISAGAHYIDTGTYRMFPLPPTERRVLLGCGLSPGLSGILPRYLAAAFDRVEGAVCFSGGCDELTAVAAQDLLDAMSDGYCQIGDYIEQGERRHRSDGAVPVSIPPYFPAAALVQPVLTNESVRIAASLGLSNFYHFSVFDGAHVAAALAADGTRENAKSISRASKLDCFGRKRYHVFLCEVTGTKELRVDQRSIALNAASGTDLTAVAAAIAARAVFDLELPCGPHMFAEVVDPTFVIDQLRQSQPAVGLSFFDGPIPSPEEGSI